MADLKDKLAIWGFIIFMWLFTIGRLFLVCLELGNKEGMAFCVFVTVWALGSYAIVKYNNRKDARDNTPRK